MFVQTFNQEKKTIVFLFQQLERSRTGKEDYVQISLFLLTR